jgi:hypothetical protein
MQVLQPASRESASKINNQIKDVKKNGEYKQHLPYAYGLQA